MREMVFSNCNRYSLPPIGTFDRSEHHRQTLDIVGTARLCRDSLLNVPYKLGHYAEVPAGLDRVGFFGGGKTLTLVKKSLWFRDIFSPNIFKAVPADRSLGADNAPDAIPRGAHSFGTPAPAKCASNASGHLK